jgi:hypothetical protein
MDQELFKQKLAEVAEFTQPKFTDTDLRELGKAARGRGRPSTESIQEQQHLEEFLRLHGGVNPTVPLELVKVKCATTCEACGLDCPNGRTVDSKLYKVSGQKHWREKCMACMKTKNPITGKFDLTPQEAPHRWAEYYRRTKGIYNTTANQLREANCIIRKYPDTDQPL